MWDDIFAEVAGDVVGSVSKKDDKGVTRTIKPGVAPTGDLLNEKGWLEACKGGAALSEKGKLENGVNAQRSVKEVSGKQAVKAAERLFGTKPATKPRTGKADELPGANPEPSANGTGH